METLRSLDYALFHFINSGMSNPVFDIFCPILRNKITWVPMYVLFFIAFYKRYSFRALYIASAAALAILLSDQLSSSVIKPFFHRLRPCNNPELIPSVHLLLDKCGAGYSFVSSHAANHFTLAVFLIIMLDKRRLTLPVLLLWALAVSFSQVYVGVHYPIDVLAGGLLGTVIGAIVALATKKLLALNTKGN